ncbi:hypothetical protein PAXINDRAFT_13419 [Paxillus involutus ATCC 200175]|uniref:Uncharacterized protein n=1 Tax=Paxillus involutus ATCC 200175 TaxID=664439 RepID=A0A0C9U309_PAXIN|nr:hypothetical protein PAXINDRAFT_13419 [Paxillus involutus ATCC 200175]
MVGRKHTAVEKASRELFRKNNTAKRELLKNALKIFQEENKTRLKALAHDHGVTDKYLKDLLGYQVDYHSMCMPTLQNTLLHVKVKKVNQNLTTGERHAPSKHCEMVASNSQMQSLSPEDEAKYIQQLLEHRDNQTHGVQANNKVASQNVLLIAKSITKTLDGLRDHTGIYASLFITCRHINDLTQMMWHGTDNLSVFWEDIFHYSAADVARQYEQWVCAQGQNLEEHDNLVSMRKQATSYILNGLTIIETFGMKLISWPKSVSIQDQSNIGTVGEMCQLHNALQSGQCHWKKLLKTECKAFTAELIMWHSVGDPVQKPHKKCADAGVSRKCKPVEGTAGSKAHEALHKRPKCNPPRSAPIIDMSDSKGEGDEE